MRPWLALPPLIVGACFLGCLSGFPLGCLVTDPQWQGASAGADQDGSADAAGATGADAGGSTDSDGGTGSGDGGGDPSDPLPADCSPLPAPTDAAIVIGPADNAMLHTIVADAPAGATIALLPGVYPRAGLPPIVLAANGVQLRSTTGVAADVVLDGDGTTMDFMVRIAADDVGIAEITLQNIDGPLIFGRAQGESLRRPRLYRLILRDASLTKIEFRASLLGDAWSEDGIAACSTFEMTDAFRSTLVDCGSMSAVRVDGGLDWVVRDNVIQGHWCASVANASVVFGDGSRDTRIIRNRLLDNFRGILLGGDRGEAPTTMPRPADDSPCGPPSPGGWGHIGGVVENNVIWIGDPQLAVVNPAFPGDSMIGFWHVCGAAALHNTIVNEVEIFNAIEWRYPETSVTVANNLTTGALMARDGAFVYGLDANGTSVAVSEFVSVPDQDFHLAATATAIDAGHIVPGLFTALDYDGNPRRGPPDLGAYERIP